MSSLLHIGADVAKLATTLPAITKSLVTLMNTSAGDAVKIAAIESLTKTFHVENVTVSGCTFRSK